jgi:hypothetical protein
MMCLTLTLLTVGIVTAITTIPTQTAEAKDKLYCEPPEDGEAGPCVNDKKTCEEDIEQKCTKVKAE